MTQNTMYPSFAEDQKSLLNPVENITFLCDG